MSRITTNNVTFDPPLTVTETVGIAEPLKPTIHTCGDDDRKGCAACREEFDAKDNLLRLPRT